MPNKLRGLIKNKVVSQIEGNNEEDDPYQFQDNVLSCLADLQHLAVAMKEKAEISHRGKAFKALMEYLSK